MRIKSGFKAHRKHKKVLQMAKGYRMTRSKLFRRAQEAVLRAGEHAFAGRRKRRRDVRTLWIIRVNAALTEKGLNYSRFINGLKKANIEINRKMLSEMAIHNPDHFDQIVKKVQETL
jgi:large subunit ribosomal protein L20